METKLIPHQVPQEFYEQLPYHIIEKITNLNSDQYRAFMSHYQTEGKSPKTAFLLALFFGIGFYFYLGKPGLGILFLITAGGFGIWAIYNCIKAKQITLKVNEELAIKILSQIS